MQCFLPIYHFKKKSPSRELMLMLYLLHWITENEIERFFLWLLFILLYIGCIFCRRMSFWSGLIWSGRDLYLLTELCSLKTLLSIKLYFCSHTKFSIILPALYLILLERRVTFLYLVPWNVPVLSPEDRSTHPTLFSPFHLQCSILHHTIARFHSHSRQRIVIFYWTWTRPTYILDKL